MSFIQPLVFLLEIPYLILWLYRFRRWGQHVVVPSLTVWQTSTRYNPKPSSLKYFFQRFIVRQVLEALAFTAFILGLARPVVWLPLGEVQPQEVQPRVAPLEVLFPKTSARSWKAPHPNPPPLGGRVVTETPRLLGLNGDEPVPGEPVISVWLYTAEEPSPLLSPLRFLVSQGVLARVIQERTRVFPIPQQESRNQEVEKSRSREVEESAVGRRPSGVRGRTVNSRWAAVDGQQSTVVPPKKYTEVQPQVVILENLYVTSLPSEERYLPQAFIFWNCRGNVPMLFQEVQPHEVQPPEVQPYEGQSQEVKKPLLIPLISPSPFPGITQWLLRFPPVRGVLFQKGDSEESLLQTPQGPLALFGGTTSSRANQTPYLAFGFLPSDTLLSKQAFFPVFLKRLIDVLGGAISRDTISRGVEESRSRGVQKSGSREVEESRSPEVQKSGKGHGASLDSLHTEEVQPQEVQPPDEHGRDNLKQKEVQPQKELTAFFMLLSLGLVLLQGFMRL